MFKPPWTIDHILASNRIEVREIFSFFLLYKDQNLGMLGMCFTRRTLNYLGGLPTVYKHIHKHRDTMETDTNKHSLHTHTHLYTKACTCIQTHTHTRTCTPIHTYTQTHTHSDTHQHTYTHAYTHLHTPTHKHMPTHTHTHSEGTKRVRRGSVVDSGKCVFLGHEPSSK